MKLATCCILAVLSVGLFVDNAGAQDKPNGISCSVILEVSEALQSQGIFSESDARMMTATPVAVGFLEGFMAAKAEAGIDTSTVPSEPIKVGSLASRGIENCIEDPDQRVRDAFLGALDSFQSGNEIAESLDGNG